MGKASREKGKRGERELASILSGEYGYKARRGQQYSGANGDADVVGLPGLHIEVKRVERLNVQDAVDQAKRDRKEGELAAVFHRKNNCDWNVTMPLTHFMAIYCEWEAGHHGEL
jgi:Holliday junction resolvase